MRMASECGDLSRRVGMARHQPRWELKGLGTRRRAGSRIGSACVWPSQPLQWAFPLFSPGVYPRALTDRWTLIIWV